MSKINTLRDRRDVLKRCRVLTISSPELFTTCSGGSPLFSVGDVQIGCPTALQGILALGS